MIYLFRIISDEDPEFYRNLVIDGADTFLDFHHTLQKNLGFDPSQLASFFITNDMWEKQQEITLIDVVIPIQSPTTLQESAIQQYEDQFMHGETPCGLSLSVLEVHGRDYWYDIGLIHFLLDGHHKMYAAAKHRCPIHLLTFCALDYGCSRLPVKLEDGGSSSFRKGSAINFLVREGLV